MLVNFWATWCPPCQKELPILSKMAAKYKKQISFVGAIVDSNKEDVLALKDRFSLNYQLGFVDSAVMNNWRAETLPTTYIINPSGIVVWAKNGILDQEILEAALKKALDSQ